MQEFDASKGLFHLFFSNDEDSFYTESYIRTKLNFFLYYKLVAMRYEYIYALTGDESSGYHLLCFDNISSKALDEKSGSLISSLFASRRQSGLNGSENEVRMKSGAKTIPLGAENSDSVILSLIALMKRKSRVAVIMNINAFNSLLCAPELADELKRINSRNYQDNNRHMFLITSSIYSGESLRFFRPGTGMGAMGNAFSDASLFPELEPYFHDIYEMTRNFYIYDELKRFLGDKAVFYNSLSYEHIRRMITSYAITGGYMEEMSIKKINSLSAVLFAYYNSAEYRKDHILGLPENQKRSLSAVEEALRNNRALRTACEKAAEEFDDCSDPYKYVCSVYCDAVDCENGIYMLGSSENQDELEMLRKIKRIYTSRTGSCDPGLDRAISVLSKPAANAAVSFSAESFRKKIIEMTFTSLSDELNDSSDMYLVDFMIRGLNYYFDYFSVAGSLRGEELTASDVSFDFYKNVAYLAEKLSRARLSKAAYEEKLGRLSENDAYSTRLFLEKTQAYIKKLEATIEKSENMLSSPITTANARGLTAEMKFETKHLKELENEGEPQNEPTDRIFNS